MLVFHRKSGQGAVIKNKNTGETFDIDYMYTRNGRGFLRINGMERDQRIQEPFYLDEMEEVMIVPIYKDMSFRLAIGAPRYWNIRRKEVAEE